MVSLALWQMTSTAMLKARAKAMASQREELVTKALIIMIKLNKATITVRAFFSVKYFFIIGGLRHPGTSGVESEQKYKMRLNLSKLFDGMRT